MAEPVGSRLASWAGGNIAFNVVAWAVTGGLPVVAGAVSGLAAWGNVPVGLLLPIIAVTFAMTALGLLRFDEFLARRTASNKLGFAAAALAFDLVTDPVTGKPTNFTFGQPIITFANQGNFALSYIVEDASWNVDGKTTNEPIPVKIGTAIPNSLLMFRLPRVDLQNTPIKDHIEGRIRFRIRYGRKGRERYEIYKHLTLSATLDKASGLFIHQALGDVVE